MEEKVEASKSYNDLFRKILFVVEVAAVVAFLGYWFFPEIVNLVYVVTVWFDWFSLVLRNIFVVFILVNVIIFLIYVSFSKTTEKNKPDLYDQYLAAVPTVVRASSFDYYDVPAFQAVKVVEERSSTYDQEVVEVSSKSYRRTRSEMKKTEKEVEYRRTESERSSTYDREVLEVSSKSYRRTRSEMKKAEKTVEYRRTESERVTKTASWRSQTMDGLSSEEFRMTVETFITEKKKTLLQEMDQRQNGVDAQWQNGVVDNWQTDVPRRLNGVEQWQRSRVDDDGNGRRHRHGHRNRSHRLVGGSGSNGSGSYLAISN